MAKLCVEAPRAPAPYTDVVLFTCRHYAFGVGTIPMAGLQRALRRLAATLREIASEVRRVLVGTLSACQGVLGELVAQASNRNQASTGR